MIVTGSSDEKGAVLEWLQTQFGVSAATVLVDPALISFNAAKLAALPLDVKVVALKGARTVHAKFYWLEGASGNAALMGSANCSRAAWITPPDQGGNVEVIAVYDDPDQGDFSSVLNRIVSDEVEPANLLQIGTESDEEHSAGHVFPVAEVSWERLLSEIKVVFVTALPDGSSVLVRLTSHTLQCGPDLERRVWSSTVTVDPFISRGTAFAEVQVVLPSGDRVPTQQIWINDQAELRNSAKTRAIGDTIRGMGGFQPSSEHQKIVAELQRIGIALLNDSSLFPDPLARATKTERPKHKSDNDADAPPVDPEKLIRSIANVQHSATGGHDSGSLNGITLSGVFRALFDFDEVGEEASTVDDPDDPNPGPISTPHPPKPKDTNGVPPPPERARARLKKDMEEYLRRFADKPFAGSCTVTQFVQAAAYPLAVVVNGAKGGWIDSASGKDWTNRVFDVLFSESYAGAFGLLDAVRRRCQETGQAEAFNVIVGDGTLWAAMLAGISRAEWSGQDGKIKKASALRKVLLSQQLLASADSRRMGALINSVERQSGASSLLALAQHASAGLTQIERYVSDNMASLQALSSKAIHMAGDVLFHPDRGWAFVLKQDPDGMKLEVYRQNSAKVMKVVAAFYLNVTRAAQSDSKLLALLKALPG